MEGWEISPDRMKVYEKMMSIDPIGDPLLVSKCQIGINNLRGTLIVSDNGFAWRLKTAGNSIWVRWYDVSRIISLKPDKGMIKIEIIKRKNGELISRKGDKLKTFSLRAILNQNKGENKNHFLERRKNFYRLMNDIFQRNKPDQIPAISDSRIQ